jgi:hypothetical protein
VSHPQFQKRPFKLCARCGTALVAYLDERGVRNLWSCEACGCKFESTVSLPELDTARNRSRSPRPAHWSIDAFGRFAARFSFASFLAARGIFESGREAMPTLEEYRSWTDQNILRARAAQTDSERLFYLDLARTYLSEVVRLDGAKGLPPAAMLARARAQILRPRGSESEFASLNDVQNLSYLKAKYGLANKPVSSP